MTISTSYNAFSDFSFEHFQNTALANQRSYSSHLSTFHMIELQHNNVGFAAVSARVRFEVFKDKGPSFSSS
jgi:hypothetical protein